MNRSPLLWRTLRCAQMRGPMRVHYEIQERVLGGGSREDVGGMFFERQRSVAVDRMVAVFRRFLIDAVSKRRRVRCTDRDMPKQRDKTRISSVIPPYLSQLRCAAAP